MTKKDYELIARAVAVSLDAVQTSELYTPEEAIRLTILVLMDALERENPRFDRQKFATQATATANRIKAWRETIEAQLAN